MTVKEFSRKLGKAQRTVENYLSGNSKIDVYTLEQIANIFEVSIEYFFNSENAETATKNFSNGGQQNIAVNNSANNINAKAEKNTLLLEQKIEFLEREIQMKDKIIKMLEEK